MAPHWSVAGGVGIVLLVYAAIGAGWAQRARSVPEAEIPESHAPITITYVVTGSGTGRAILTMRTDSFATNQVEVDLPWETTYTGFAEGDRAYVTARSRDGTGTLRCEIRVDDVTVFSGEASGDSTCTAAGDVHAVGSPVAAVPVATTTPIGQYPDATRTAFLDSCASGMSDAMCRCVLGYTEDTMSEEEYLTPGLADNDLLTAGVQECARQLHATLTSDEATLLERSPVPGGGVSVAEVMLALDAADLPIVDWVVYTAATDPNQHLGEEGWYYGKALFLDERLTGRDGLPSSLDLVGTTFDVRAGGSIEVFDSRQAATDRSAYLSAVFALTGDGEYHFVAGSVLLRVSKELPEVGARDYWAALRAVLR